MQVHRFFYGELTVQAAPDRDGRRHYVLTDGRFEGYVTCTGLRVHASGE
jgi:hypothetical protein